MTQLHKFIFHFAAIMSYHDWSRCVWALVTTFWWILDVQLKFLCYWVMFRVFSDPRITLYIFMLIFNLSIFLLWCRFKLHIVIHRHAVSFRYKALLYLIDRSVTCSWHHPQKPCVRFFAMDQVTQEAVFITLVLRIKLIFNWKFSHTKISQIVNYLDGFVLKHLKSVTFFKSCEVFVNHGLGVLLWWTLFQDLSSRNELYKTSSFFSGFENRHVFLQNAVTIRF